MGTFFFTFNCSKRQLTKAKIAVIHCTFTANVKVIAQMMGEKNIENILLKVPYTTQEVLYYLKPDSE